MIGKHKKQKEPIQEHCAQCKNVYTILTNYLGALFGIFLYLLCEKHVYFLCQRTQTKTQRLHFVNYVYII